MMTTTTTTIAESWNVSLAEKGATTCGSNLQPIIESEWACLAAMHAIGQNGQTYDDTENEGDFPKGCYKFLNEGDTYTYLNLHPTGSAQSESQLYCQEGLEPIPPGGTLFVGDSDIDYWSTSGETVPGSFNIGIGGDTCVGILDYIDDVMEEMEPRQVVLVCGENDLEEGYSVQATFENFKSIADKIIAAGSKLLFLGTKPEPDTSSLHRKYVQYDNRIAAYARTLAVDADGNGEPPPITFIDVYSAFENIGNPKSLYASDDLHLSSNGYSLWDEWTSQALSDDVGSRSCIIWSSGECVTLNDGSSPTSASSISKLSAGLILKLVIANCGIIASLF